MCDLPPTARLPPIQQLSSCAPPDLAQALKYLRTVLSPPVRGSRRRSDDAGSAVLTLDPFEKAYAIRWLTSLVSRAACEAFGSTSCLNASIDELDALTCDASALLALCAGTAAAGFFSHSLTFGSAPDMIQLEITDAPLEHNDIASVGAQTWGAACVLSEIIVEDVHGMEFGLHGTEEVRVLELGAGTGLVSMVVGRLLCSRRKNGRVVATDHHPTVLKNLERNIEHTFPSSDEYHGVSIACHPLDWSAWPNLTSPAPPLDEPFDLVLGADIVYDARHAVWIKSCLHRLLRKPLRDKGDREGGYFHLVIPLRPTYALESLTVKEVFSYPEVPGDEHAAGEIFLGIMEERLLIRGAHEDSSGEEVEYAYYKIGWLPMPFTR
jgi:hypothetical protein